MIKRTPDADQDIDAIAEEIAARSQSIEVAVRWLQSVDRFIDKIATAPGVGTIRDSTLQGLRSVPFGNYLVFFRKIKRGIEVMRIIHGARRWEREFLDPH